MSPSSLNEVKHSSLGDRMPDHAGFAEVTSQCQKHTTHQEIADREKHERCLFFSPAPYFLLATCDLELRVCGGSLRFVVCGEA
jgi:hypothetical protein